MPFLKEIRSNRFYKHEMQEAVCIVVSGFIVFALSILAIRFSGKRPVFLVFGVLIMFMSSCCMCYGCRKTNKTYKDAQEAYVVNAMEANVVNKKHADKKEDNVKRHVSLDQVVLEVPSTDQPSAPDRVESREEGE